MKKIKHKAIQLKSWVSHCIRTEDGKVSLCKLSYFIMGWLGLKQYILLLLKSIKFTFEMICLILPYAIHFIEGLISALSYSLNKKEFFYGI